MELRTVVCIVCLCGFSNWDFGLSLLSKVLLILLLELWQLAVFVTSISLVRCKIYIWIVFDLFMVMLNELQIDVAVFNVEFIKLLLLLYSVGMTMVVSSANKIHFWYLPNCSGRLFMYIMKNKGPRINPWRISFIVILKDDLVLLIMLLQWSSNSTGCFLSNN